MDDARRAERRIGERRLLPAVEVVWDLAEGRLGGPFRKRPTVEERRGQLVDASVTGAGMEAVAHKALVVGAQLVLAHDGGLSLVRIARVAASDRPGQRRYGLEFVKLDDRLRAAIFAVVAKGRPLDDATPYTPPRPPAF